MLVAAGTRVVHRLTAACDSSTFGFTQNGRLVQSREMVSETFASGSGERKLDEVEVVDNWSLRNCGVY